MPELSDKTEIKWIMNSMCKFNPALADLTIKIANLAKLNNSEMAFFELKGEYYALCIDGKNIFLVLENETDLKLTTLKEYKDSLKNNDGNVLISCVQKKQMLVYRIPNSGDDASNDDDSELDGAFSTKKKIDLFLINTF